MVELDWNKLISGFLVWGNGGSDEKIPGFVMKRRASISKNV